MVKENILIKTLQLEDIKNEKIIYFKNCSIDRIDLIGTFELNVELVISNCYINKLEIHSCWFINGFVLKNCIVNNYVDYQMGGHNKKPILIEGNTFNEFVNFFDCQFEDVIEIKNNIFVKGTNFLGNRDEGFENTFIKGWIEKNNLGDVDLDGIGL